HRAVAVPHELEGSVGFESDVAAQAGAPDRHASSSSRAAWAAGGESSTRAKPLEWIARHEDGYDVRTGRTQARSRREHRATIAAARDYLGGPRNITRRPRPVPGPTSKQSH